LLTSIGSSPIVHIEVADETQTKTLSASEQSRQELEEELKVRRALAQKDADAHLPYVAQTLQKLGVLDYREHRTEEARQQFEEALKISRELAQKNPESYLPGLAQALHNHSRK
jgi:tetratricopeptide (TPR) repeat protein